MKRRGFVQRLPVVAAGVAAGLGPVSLTACAGAPYLIPRSAPGGLLVDMAALGNAGDAFIQGRGMERPIYVRRTPSGEFTAVLASCTHNGCQPESIGDRLACPCHGSEFTFEGNVLAGPADRPLTRYVVERAGDAIVVRLGEGNR